MIRLRPTKKTMNQSRVSYEVRTPTRPHDLQVAVRVERLFLP